MTITLAEDVRELALKFAREAGLPLSTWIAEAVADQARLRERRAAMREWEAEEGPIPPEARAWAREVLAAAAAASDAGGTIDVPRPSRSVRPDEQ